VIKFGYGKFLLCLVLVIFAIIILGHIVNFDRSKELMAAAAKNSQINNTLSAITDQVVPQDRNISSNQSDDIKAIRNSMSEQVQLLRNIMQGFAKTTTQASFAALGVFLLGTALLLYGLRLTLGTTAKRARTFIKVMMYALITPVIVIIAIYQFGLLTGISIGFLRTGEPFFFISLLLLIPAGIVLFLLIAEQRILSGHHKEQQ
jgi:hypothetical protein